MYNYMCVYIHVTSIKIYQSMISQEIYGEKCDVRIGIDNISVLLYADDIVLLAETPNNLQILLKHLNQ